MPNYDKEEFTCDIASTCIYLAVLFLLCLFTHSGPTEVNHKIPAYPG